MESSAQEQIATLSYRMQTIEHDLQFIRGQFTLYVSGRENDLQLKPIRDAIERLERELSDLKSQIRDLKQQVSTQDDAAKSRDTIQRESQDKLQIRVLWYIVSGILTILIALLIAYLTHFIH